MPLQNILVSEAHQRMNESDNPDTVAMPVGQIVGRMNEIRPVADIIAELVEGFEDATRRLDGIRESSPRCRRRRTSEAIVVCSSITVGRRAHELALVLQAVGVELQHVETVWAGDHDRLLGDDLGHAFLRPGATQLDRPGSRRGC